MCSFLLSLQTSLHLGCSRTAQNSRFIATWAISYYDRWLFKIKLRFQIRILAFARTTYSMAVCRYYQKIVLNCSMVVTHNTRLSVMQITKALFFTVVS